MTGRLQDPGHQLVEGAVERFFGGVVVAHTSVNEKVVAAKLEKALNELN